MKTKCQNGSITGDMILVSYDIADDKLRSRFSKFLSKFGYRLQYSVFKIKNSQRVLANIVAEIKNVFEKEFDMTDSIYVFQMSATCKIDTYGYAKNEEADSFFV